MTVSHVLQRTKEFLWEFRRNSFNNFGIQMSRSLVSSPKSLIRSRKISFAPLLRDILYIAYTYAACLQDIKRILGLSNKYREYVRVRNAFIDFPTIRLVVSPRRIRCNVPAVVVRYFAVVQNKPLELLPPLFYIPLLSRATSRTWLFSLTRHGLRDVRTLLVIVRIEFLPIKKLRLQRATIIGATSTLWRTV